MGISVKVGRTGKAGYKLCIYIYIYIEKFIYFIYYILLMLFKIIRLAPHPPTRQIGKAWPRRRRLSSLSCVVVSRPAMLGQYQQFLHKPAQYNNYNHLQISSALAPINFALSLSLSLSLSLIFFPNICFTCDARCMPYTAQFIHQSFHRS